MVLVQNMKKEIQENLNYKHFFQVTKIAKPIPAVVPTEEELFGTYWEKFGKQRERGHKE